MRPTLLATCLAAFLLAACGGSGKPTPATPEPAAADEAAAEPAAQDEPAADDEVGDCDSDCYDECFEGGGTEDDCMVSCC